MKKRDNGRPGLSCSKAFFLVFKSIFSDNFLCYFGAFNHQLVEKKN